MLQYSVARAVKFQDIPAASSVMVNFGAINVSTGSALLTQVMLIVVFSCDATILKVSPVFLSAEGAVRKTLPQVEVGGICSTR